MKLLYFMVWCVIIGGFVYLAMNKLLTFHYKGLELIP